MSLIILFLLLLHWIKENHSDQRSMLHKPEIRIHTSKKTLTFNVLNFLDAITKISIPD